MELWDAALRIRSAFLRAGTIAAMICLPVLAHGLELLTHTWRGTPNLGASIVASMALTALSTAFHVYAMRRGVMVVGVGHALPLGEDLRQLPGLLRDFMVAAVAELRRVSTAPMPFVLAVALAHVVATVAARDVPMRLFVDRPEPEIRYVREHVIRVALGKELAAVLLVSGSMRVDATGDLLEIRGRLSRNPSFWTTSVDVVRRYARIDGVRVAVETEAVSSVRVAGPSHLRVDYHYERINDRDVSPAARAAAWPPAPWHPR